MDCLRGWCLGEILILLGKCHSAIQSVFTLSKAGFDNVLPALGSMRQMPWGIEVFITSSQDWGKHIIVVKLCMSFESGPEWIVTLF
jgi:hypothetical protein